MNKIVTASAILLLTTCFGPSLVRTQQRNYDPFASRSDYFSKLHVIRVFVKRYGRSRVNRLFVAKTDSGDGVTKGLYGYWPEGHSILVLDHFNPVFDGGKELTDYDWLEYKTRIDLHTDVVATERDVGWSSYLVDRPWVRRIIDACLRSGRKITIYRNRYTSMRAPLQNPTITKTVDERTSTSFNCRKTKYRFVVVDNPNRTRDSDPVMPEDLNLVVGDDVIAKVELPKESEAKNFSLNAVEKTETGFEIKVDWGGGIDHYEVQFNFRCRGNKFYLYRVTKLSFSTTNPDRGFLDRKKSKTTRVEPNLPIEKFVMTDYL